MHALGKTFIIIHASKDYKERLIKDPFWHAIERIFIIRAQLIKSFINRSFLTETVIPRLSKRKAFFGRNSLEKRASWVFLKRSYVGT